MNYLHQYPRWNSLSQRPLQFVSVILCTFLLIPVKHQCAPEPTYTSIMHLGNLTMSLYLLFHCSLQFTEPIMNYPSRLIITSSSEGCRIHQYLVEWRRLLNKHWDTFKKSVLIYHWCFSLL